MKAKKKFELFDCESICVEEKTFKNTQKQHGQGKLSWFLYPFL